MSIAASLLPELDHEAATTRRCLERLPADRLDWRPHERSWTLRELATHIANLPRWATMTIEGSGFDMAASPERPEPVASAEDAAETFDRRTAAARAALEAATDGDLMAPWTLSSGDHTIFTMPRVAVLRSFVMNHLIHHRGQLSVYLRLLDVPVPAIYGPSADES